MAAKRLCLAFTVDQLGQEGLSPAPQGLVLSELSNLLNEIEGAILAGRMILDLSDLSSRVHKEQIKILQEVLIKAGFSMSILYKDQFQQDLYNFNVSNAFLLIEKLR